MFRHTSFVRLRTYSPHDTNRKDDLHLVLSDWHPLHPHLPVGPGPETPGPNLQTPLLLHLEAPSHGQLPGQELRGQNNKQAGVELGLS